MGAYGRAVLKYYFYFVENSSSDFFASKDVFGGWGVGKKGSINGFIECVVTGC